MPEVGEIKYGWEIGRLGCFTKHIWQACAGCNKERWVQLCYGKPRSLRCISCHNRKGPHFTGERSTAWKGGRVKHSQGYILVRLQPDDFFYSMACKSGYVKEHRLVVAKALGRCLHRWEIVHHKHDKYPAGSVEDKQDNRYPENLQLVSDDRHKQLTVLEQRIKYLEQRVTLLEAENSLLKGGLNEGALYSCRQVWK